MKPFKTAIRQPCESNLKYFWTLHQWNKLFSLHSLLISSTHSASPPASRCCLNVSSIGLTLPSAYNHLHWDSRLSPSKFSLEFPFGLSFSLIIYYHIMCEMSIEFNQLLVVFGTIRHMLQTYYHSIVHFYL